MPHSFSVLNFATCVSNRLASVPNHGCQTVTCAPRSDSVATSKLLTAGAGVFSADASSVAFGRGVRVPEFAAFGLAQEESMNTKSRNEDQAFRDAVMLIRHHGDGSEDQKENEQDEEPKRASLGIQFGDVVQWLCADVAQPEQNEQPQ